MSRFAATSWTLTAHRARRLRLPFDVLGPDRPRGSRPNRAETDPADPDANEPQDRRADGAEHASELALPALGERGLIPDEVGLWWRVERVRELRRLGARGQAQWAGQPRGALVQANPRVQRVDLLAR